MLQFLTMHAAKFLLPIFKFLSAFMKMYVTTKMSHRLIAGLFILDILKENKKI